MVPTKVVSLSAVASQVSNLCFEVGGILGESNVKLGKSVAAFDFAAFYGTLGSMPTVPGHPARLIYDFLEIQAFVKKFTLVALRSELNKASLSKAVNARANAYYAKYANAPAVISRMNNFYSTSIAGSKPNRLSTLGAMASQQAKLLKDAYTNDGRTGVVKTTNSVLDSQLSSDGTTKTDEQSDVTSIEFPAVPQTFDAPPFGGGIPNFTVTGSDVEIHENVQMSKGYQGSASTGSGREHQTILSTDYGYRIPYLECQAQNERAQISLIDEQFAQFMDAQNLPYLAAVFQNELNSIDSDVYRTQIAYLNTILMSPIRGTVTGTFKNPGDAVRPGEPVIRVENNDVVLLVATLVHGGPISIGSNVLVETKLFDIPGPLTPIGGNVVAVRGLQDDDSWQVIIECNNLDGGGKPILPLGYHFDYLYTTVTIL